MRQSSNIDAANSLAMLLDFAGHRAESHFRDLYAAAEERVTKERPTVPFTLPSEAVVEKPVHAL
jgi:hypothetical protein